MTITSRSASDEPMSTPGGLQRFRLDGRVAVVTGAASGIGLACARLLGEAGAKVVLLDLDAQLAEHEAAQLANSVGRGLDVSDAAAI